MILNGCRGDLVSVTKFFLLLKYHSSVLLLYGPVFHNVSLVLHFLYCRITLLFLKIAS